MFNANKYKPFHPIDLPDRQWPKQQIQQAPQWCAVDLRDGNQALLEPMTVEQKQQLFDLQVQLGFKQIEVGFPAASQPDFDFVRQLIEQDKIPHDVTIQVLVQARESLISRTFEALKDVKQAIVHVYNSTSPTQRNRVFKQDKSGVKAIAVQGAQWVKEYAAKTPETQWTFQYSPESFSGTEPEFAAEVCNAVLGVWQMDKTQKCIINLPATVEMTTPNVFADQVEYMHRHLQNRQDISLSIHTHNDRGCAVAAAELALLAGADRIEGTLLGNGERTGNMDIITMAMNLYSQGIDPELDLSNPAQIIQVVQDCTQLPVHPRHPWFGELVYTAFSGSHQDAINKCLTQQDEQQPWDVAYLPIDPKDIGRTYQEVIKINSQSGKGGMAFILQQEYQLQLPRWLQIDFSAKVQKACESIGGELSGEQIHEEFINHYSQQNHIQLQGYRWDNQQGLEANILWNTRRVALSGTGNGPLDALIKAINRQFDSQLIIEQYEEHNVDANTAAAYISLNIEGKSEVGFATDQDSMAAAIKACINALARSEQRLHLKEAC